MLLFDLFWSFGKVGVFGFGGIYAGAKIPFFVFIVLFVVSLVMGRSRGGL